MKKEDDILFMHCKDCISELPKGLSPSEYQKGHIAVILNKTTGCIEIYCKRHGQVASLQLHENALEMLATDGTECQCEICKQTRESEHSTIH